MIAGVLVAAPACAASLTSERPHARAGAVSTSPWSDPAPLSRCPSVGGAQVAFPSASPTARTGAGAIVWSASAGCPGGEGARVSVLGPGERPGPSLLPRGPAGATVAPRGQVEAVGAPAGRILIAGSRPAAPSQLLAIQGAAAGPFSILHEVAAAASPAAITRAYLGDVAIASAPPAGAGVSVQLERFYTTHFAAPLPAAPAGTPAMDPVVALDFRTDALAVWRQGSGLYARYMPTRGAARAVQRLSSVAPGARVTALLSDDGRGMVAWSEGRGAAQSVHLDISGPGVSFGAPRVLERFTAPDALRPAASPILIRLRSESVMIAWAGASAGHWVLRTAPVELGGIGTVSTIAPAGQDALLQALAPGPDGEALLLWGQPAAGPAGAPQSARSALYAARGFRARPRRVDFGAPEPIAAPGPNSGATVAVDPTGDDAVAVWRGAGGAIEYSIRASSRARGARLAGRRSAPQGTDRKG